MREIVRPLSEAVSDAAEDGRRALRGRPIPSSDTVGPEQATPDAKRAQGGPSALAKIGLMRMQAFCASMDHVSLAATA